MVFGWLIASASAGDVWMTIQATDPAGSVKAYIPAACVSGEEPTRVTLSDGRTLDVQSAIQEIQSSRPGTSRSFHIPGEQPGQVAHLTLTHQSPTAAGTTSLLLSALGPMGAGLSFTVPLSRDGMGRAARDLDLSRVGLSLQIDDQSALEVIRRYPPVTLLEITGKNGGTLQVRSQ